MSGEPPERSQEEGTAASSPNQPTSNALVIPSYVAPTGQSVSAQPVLYLPVHVSSLSGFQVAFTPDQSTTIVGEALAEGRKKPRDPTKKSVRVLKQFDVKVSDGTVFMPNEMKKAELQKPEKGQFKTEMQIADPNMTDMDIKRLLVETFPFLENTRFYCAKASGGRLDFVGEPRIWDGRTIRKNLNGNSALYIFAEESPGHSREQIVASGTNKSQSAAGSNMGSPLEPLKTGAVTATTTLVNNVASSPSVPTASCIGRGRFVVSQPPLNALAAVPLLRYPQHAKRPREKDTNSRNEPFDKTPKKKKASSQAGNHRTMTGPASSPATSAASSSLSLYDPSRQFSSMNAQASHDQCGCKSDSSGICSQGNSSEPSTSETSDSEIIQREIISTDPKVVPLEKFDNHLT